VLGCVLLFGLLAIAYGYDRVSADHFYPGTHIGTVAVGSLTEAQAAERLHDTYVTELKQEITLTAPEYKRSATPWSMGMRVDVIDIARDALVTQQARALPVRLWLRVVGEDRVAAVEPTIKVDLFDAFLEKVYKEVNQDAKDARMEVIGDKLKVIPHTLGRKVDKKAAETAIFAALQARDRSVELTVDVVEPELLTESFKTVIVVSTSRNRLKLYGNGEVKKEYGVATGTGGFPTPHGQWRITLKRMNPTWYNPNSDWSRDMPAFIPPGPSNPLGTRALNLNASGIRIHGTPDAASIGTNASHGCIRMHMRDIEELFEKVEVGTPVLII
jgi:lipoprotein-anchoring transpeptidase ErfK/SrfK